MNAAFPEVETDEEDEKTEEKKNGDDEEKDENMDSDDEDDYENRKEWFRAWQQCSMGKSVSRSERCSKYKLYMWNKWNGFPTRVHLKRLLMPKRWIFYYRLIGEGCEGCTYTI